MDGIDLDERGRLFWMVVPEQISKAARSGRDFESVRNAVRFWATELTRPSGRTGVGVAEAQKQQLPASLMHCSTDVAQQHCPGM